jgi:hypothetical protein
VQAYNTVSVKSRVDGNITQVGYQEGQDVILLSLPPASVGALISF